MVRGVKSYWLAMLLCAALLIIISPNVLAGEQCNGGLYDCAANCAGTCSEYSGWGACLGCNDAASCSACPINDKEGNGWGIYCSSNGCSSGTCVAGTCVPACTQYSWGDWTPNADGCNDPSHRCVEWQWRLGTCNQPAGCSGSSCTGSNVETQSVSSACNGAACTTGTGGSGTCSAGACVAASGSCTTINRGVNENGCGVLFPYQSYTIDYYGCSGCDTPTSCCGNNLGCWDSQTNKYTCCQENIYLNPGQPGYDIICQPETCPSGTTKCDGICVATTSDPNNCGGCGSSTNTQYSCPTLKNNGPVCVSSTQQKTYTGTCTNSNCDVVLKTCDSGKTCPASPGALGSCQAACTDCLIDGQCWADGAAKPGNPCRVCNKALSSNSWSLSPTCDPGYEEICYEDYDEGVYCFTTSNCPFWYPNPPRACCRKDYTVETYCNYIWSTPSSVSFTPSCGAGGPGTTGQVVATASDVTVQCGNLAPIGTTKPWQGAQLKKYGDVVYGDVVYSEESGQAPTTISGVGYGIYSPVLTFAEYSMRPHGGGGTERIDITGYVSGSAIRVCCNDVKIYSTQYNAGMQSACCSASECPSGNNCFGEGSDVGNELCAPQGSAWVKP